MRWFSLITGAEKPNRLRRTNASKETSPAFTLAYQGFFSSRENWIVDSTPQAWPSSAPTAEVPLFWLPSRNTGAGCGFANGVRAARSVRRRTTRSLRRRKGISAIGPGTGSPVRSVQRLPMEARNGGRDRPPFV